MQDHSSLTVLIIDPNPVMRSSLHNMLNQVQINKIEYAVNSGTAIRQLAKKAYDIILCEYDLGNGNDGGQDGQQLLEDLRHHKLIGPTTIFIMITSEGVYSKVVSAAELTPNDYILKPFTVDVLSGRITRAIEHRSAFLSTYQLIAQGNLRGAIKSCVTAEASHPRYAAEFVRLRAEQHVSLNELAEAEQIYGAVLATKPVGWARLGLAKTLFDQERFEDAQNCLNQLVVEQPTFMAAYDWLARCHEAKGELDEAQKALELAVAKSPNMLRRLRRLGEVALDAGDTASAERCFKQVVAKAKYSEFRDPEDHVNLVRALVVKGDLSGAGSVIRDLEKSLRSNAATDTCRAVSGALVAEAAGDAAGAVAHLNTAVQAMQGNDWMSNRMKFVMVKTCLGNQLDKPASEIMLGMVNDPNSGVKMGQALSVFAKAGRPDLSGAMDTQLKEQAQQAIAEAAGKTEAGEMEDAVQILLGALRKTPTYLPVLSASIYAIVAQMDQLGWENPLGEQCRGLLDSVAKLDPAFPHLTTMTEQYQACGRKFGIAT